MMFDAKKKKKFPKAIAATDLTGKTNGATSLKANEYVLMDPTHNSNKCEILQQPVELIRANISNICPYLRLAPVVIARVPFWRISSF